MMVECSALTAFDVWQLLGVPYGWSDLSTENTRADALVLAPTVFCSKGET